MPLLRLMLNRAPKLTARTFYAPLLHLTHNRATNRKQCAETAVNHISQTPPEARVHRGAAPEPLCVPSAQEQPSTAVDIINRKDGVFLLFYHFAYQKE